MLHPFLVCCDTNTAKMSCTKELGVAPNLPDLDGRCQGSLFPIYGNLKMLSPALPRLVQVVALHPSVFRTALPVRKAGTPLLGAPNYPVGKKTGQLGNL